MVKKTFKCEYYQVVEHIEGENREAYFDYQKWAEETMEIKLEERKHPYKEDSVRLEETYFHPTYNMLFTRYMRGRITDVPYLARDNSKSEPIVLEDGQYISEDVTCLYDSTNHVLMIQKNSHSVSPIGIEQYLNDTTPPNIEVKLRKVVATDSFERASKAKKCRKIIVRLADIQTLRRKGILSNLKSSVGKMVQSTKEIPSPYLEFTFSVGMDRGAEIDETEFDNIISDIKSNPIAFDRAKVSIMEENEAKMNMVDLFLDSPREEISFEINKPNNPIRFDAMMDKMGQKYCPGENRENRRKVINSYLRQ